MSIAKPLTKILKDRRIRALLLVLGVGVYLYCLWLYYILVLNFSLIQR